MNAPRAPRRKAADPGPIWLCGPTWPLTRFQERPKFRGGLYRIAPDTYAWMVPNGSWGETNLGLIDCAGSSVMVDTGWDLRCTQEMLEACAEITTESPIELVINTHADGDHCWGNQLFADRPILATHACIRQMALTPPLALRALYHGCACLRHVPLAGIDQFGHYMREMLRPYDFADVRITPASQGFSQRETLQVRGVEIEVLEVGPGHTDGDAIVHLPSRRVAFAGDILFVGVTPVMWAGPIEQLEESLHVLLGLDVDVIVPGHGPLANRRHVQHMLDYWRFVHQALSRRFTQGMSATEAARDVLLSEAFQEGPWAQWDSPERLVSSAHTLYRQWGAPPSALPGKLAQMNLMRHQARVAFNLPHATPRVMRHP